MKKLIRTATVSVSLDILLKGQLGYLNNFFQVIAVSGRDYNLEALSGCKDHLKVIAERERVRTQEITMSRGISPLKDIVSLINLYLLFRKEQPYIVHSITPKAGLLSMTAAYFARVPVRIHTFTGLVFPSKTGIMRRVLIAMDQLLCRFATTIVPEGQGVKNDLILYNITSKPLKIIANGNVNGIDLAYFDPVTISEVVQKDLKNQLGILATDFVYVFVGRLVKDKGINELVEAFVTLSSVRPAVKLLLVGPFESDLDPLNLSTITHIHNHPGIISVGFQSDVRPYFAVSHALVFPSYREGFPNVVMQAGAMGLPSIVTDINGCNEIIVAGENGIIIPVKDVVTLQEAMEQFLDERCYYPLQQKAREMIASRYEQHLVWEALLAEYNRLVE